MPRVNRTTHKRKRKLTTWAKKSKQRGGFIFSLAAIGSAIAAAVSAAAPAVGTAVASSAAAYATTKILQKVGGRKTIKRKRPVRIRGN
jgi:hypothetical protein